MKYNIGAFRECFCRKVRSGSNWKDAMAAAVAHAEEIVSCKYGALQSRIDQYAAMLDGMGITVEDILEG